VAAGWCVNSMAKQSRLNSDSDSLEKVDVTAIGGNGYMTSAYLHNVESDESDVTVTSSRMTLLGRPR
jgi:hypothetical protein